MAERTFEEIWADVTPVPQDDGPNPVVKIAYTAEFTKCMDIFRAVVAKGEYSERVLNLTEELLELNAANYTIWQYRRECLKKLNSDLNEELDYLDGFSRENPKNYQIWHHRRTVVEWLGNGDRELAFCDAVFAEDAKNYHAWAHRQWALRAFNLWDQELAYIEQILEKDIRNNSAWNQRWFYVHQGPEMLTTEIVHREVQYAWTALQTVTLNESAWNYLRGLAKSHREEAAALVKSRCEEMAARSGNQNVFALGLLADLCVDEATMILSASTVTPTSAPAPPTAAAAAENAATTTPPPAADGEGSSTITALSTQPALQLLRRSEELCLALVTLDAIRAKSWTRRLRGLQQQVSMLAPVKV